MGFEFNPADEDEHGQCRHEIHSLQHHIADWKHATGCQTPSDVQSAAKEIERLQELNSLILSGLRWNGDGYEWTGAEYDYRLNPAEAVGLMKADRDQMRERISRLEQACDIFEKNSSNAAEMYELLRLCYWDAKSPAYLRSKEILEKLEAMFEPKGACDRDGR